MTLPWAIPIFDNLTIPSTAGPGQARIVIASVLPPPLDTYTFTDLTSGGTFRYTSAILYYPDGDDTSYHYDASVGRIAGPDLMIRHLGEVDQGAVVESAVGFPKVIGMTRNITTNAGSRYFLGTTLNLQASDQFAASSVNDMNLGSTAGNTNLTGGGAQVQATSAGSVSITPASGQSTVVVDGGGGGQLVIGPDIDWASSTTVENEQNGAVSTASTTYVALGGANTCGVAFVAPPSGKVIVWYGSSMDASGAAVGANAAPQLRDGSTVGAGSIVAAYTASDTRCIAMLGVDNMDVGRTMMMTGLTAGNSYNVELLHRCRVPGTAFFANRNIGVTPAL